jgi:flagellar hook assembly protein FlgD
VDEHLKAGHKLVDWDGKDEWGKEVSSGIYFYRVKTSGLEQSKKMLLLK